MLKSFLDGFTRGRPQQEPPSPYSYVPATSGLGIGVSNFVFQQSHTRLTDSYRGRQGIQVQRNLCPLEQAVWISGNSLPYVDIVALASGVNYMPGPTTLIPKNGG